MLNKKISFILIPLVATISLHANDPFFDDPFGDDIFKEMMQMQRNMDKMFDQMQNRMQQRVSRQIKPIKSYKIAPQQSEFEDRGNSYEFITNIPENKDNQVNIESKDGVLSISAKIVEKHETKTQNGYSTSSSMRMYQRSVSLPDDADEQSIDIKYKNEKLVITMAKKKNRQKVAPYIKTNTLNHQKSNSNSLENNSSIDKNSTKNKIKIDSDMPSVS